jgi:dephospho-CoA kinase
MFGNKPVIGLLGGIGSGKSFIAKCFGELGCMVIDSDVQVRAAYREDQVIETLRQWWGAGVVGGDGAVDRAFIARIVFADPAERIRLEKLVHPIVNEARKREMERGANDPLIVAFVWDTPLLLEAGLAGDCDVLVYVEASAEQRQARVMNSRGWAVDELIRREKFQAALDNKRGISDYIVSNTADAAFARDQVRDLFPRILAQVAQRSAKGSSERS